MSVNVGSANVTKLVDNVLSPREVRVRNDGPSAVTLSKDPAIVAGQGFQLALNAEEDVSLEVGEAVYAICAAGLNAVVEVL